MAGRVREMQVLVRGEASLVGVGLVPTEPESQFFLFRLLSSESLRQGEWGVLRLCLLSPLRENWQPVLMQSSKQRVFRDIPL